MEVFPIKVFPRIIFICREINIRQLISNISVEKWLESKKNNQKLGKMCVFSLSALSTIQTSIGSWAKLGHSLLSPLWQW